MIIGLMGQAGVGKDTAGAILAAELGGVTLAFADPIKRWCMLALKLREQQLWGSLKEKETPLKKSQLARRLPNICWPGAAPSLTWTNYLADACCVEAYRTRAAGEGRLWATREWWVNSDVEISMRKWWEELRTEQKLTSRRVMQHFGTEFVRRKIEPRFWIHQAMRISDALLEGGYRYSRTEGLIADASAQVNAVVITDVRFRNEVVVIKKRGGEVYGVTRPGPVDQFNRMRRDVKRVRGKVVELERHASEQEQLSVPQFWLDGRFINRFESKADFEHAVKYVARNIAARGPVLF